VDHMVGASAVKFTCRLNGAGSITCFMWA
jgi:hypothetical protein